MIYNVFDYAQVGNNAFSFTKYDKNRQKIAVGICDFGIGIVNSVRNHIPNIGNDKKALEKSIEVNFTIASTEHNRGWGLENILNNSDIVRIFSGEAVLIKVGEKKKVLGTNIKFPGTLIYLEVDILKLEDNDSVIDYFDIWS